MTVGGLISCRDQDVLILDTGLGSDEEQGKITDLLQFEKPIKPDNSGELFMLQWF